MDNSNTKKSVLSGLVWKFAERFLAQGMSLVVSLVLARLLMPEDYGAVALVTVFINLSMVFVNNGFSTALIQKKDADATDYSTVFYCSLAVSLVIYAILFLIAPLVSRIYDLLILTPVLRVFALQIPLCVYNTIQMAYVSKHMLFRKVFFSSAVNTLVSGAVGIAMAWMGFGVWALVAQSLSAIISNTVVLSVMIPWRPEWKFSKTSAKSMMKYGMNILGADLSGTFFNELRSLIIGGVYSSADLAFYNKGQQIPYLITGNASTAVMTVIFPALANIGDDMARVKQVVKRSVQTLAYVLVPCMFGMAAVSEPMILFLFTEKWAQTIPFSQILSVSLCIGLFGVIPLQVIKAIGRSDVVFKLEFWKKPVYVLLLILGVQTDVYGLAVAMLIYDIFGSIVNMLQLQKYIGYSLAEQLKDLFSVFALSTAMAFAVWLIPSFHSLFLTLVLKVLAGAVIYVTASVVFRMESFGYLLGILKERLRPAGKT